MKQAAYDMLYLATCALNDSDPDAARVAEMDFDKLFRMCQFHSLTALVCYALERPKISLPAAWTEAKAKAIRKNILLDAERQRITGYMEQNGIWYMPLKGVILKELYPKIGMRQMSDNDILFDENYRKQMTSYMLENGYIPEGIGKNNHDAYLKDPVYNFELHIQLFNEIVGDRFCTYYRDIKQQLIKDEGNAFGYHFTDEDFYIYIIAHEYKHYSISGTGLRSLLDVAVYLRAKADLMNWDYLHEELSKLQLEPFEEQARRLSLHLLQDPDLQSLSKEENAMLDDFLFSGTYGTLEGFANKGMQREKEKGGKFSKARYIWKRIFPSIYLYKINYPFFYRHKLLLPVAWFYRLIRAIFRRPKAIRAELSAVKKWEE